MKVTSCNSTNKQKGEINIVITLYQQKARATTKKIETPADLDGFVEMRDEEKDEIKSLIKEFVSSKSPAKPKKKTKKVEEAREGGGKKFLLAAAAAG